MGNSAPIAVFDSGLGGLSVWKEIVKALPNESILYFGDGKYCPYGNKTKEELIPIVDAITRLLIERGAKLIVIACNTATTEAIEYLREKYDIPFVGMEPAVKPAAQATKSGVIGIIATEATLHGGHFSRSRAKYSSQVEIISGVGDGFVELVENNMENTSQALSLVSNCLEPMLERGADHIVLGCTHYPFLLETIKKVIGKRDVTILDPAPAIAARVDKLLKDNSIESTESNCNEYTFDTNSDENYRQRLIEKSKKIIKW